MSGNEWDEMGVEIISSGAAFWNHVFCLKRQIKLRYDAHDDACLARPEEGIQFTNLLQLYKPMDCGT
uniref:Uncharacterized protein n=1 Tax=Romanomermis culicivorax TaxID=13658 RepID=A0A915KM94_ROMCU